jgi:hypothetical protein
MVTLLLLLLLATPDDGPGIDPDGSGTTINAGSSMDPNGLDAGARIDDNG